MKAKCPKCKLVIWLEPLNEVGDRIYCEHCDAVLEVVETDPLKMEVINEVESEDYFDGYEDGEEEESEE
ncbi:MAG: lysine biosynthesis protein LysW [Candidatus Omnitrophota bacterium]